MLDSPFANNSPDFPSRSLESPPAPANMSKDLIKAVEGVVPYSLQDVIMNLSCGPPEGEGH